MAQMPARSDDCWAGEGPACVAGALPLTASVFADRGHVRAMIAEDAVGAGFRLTLNGSIAALLEGSVAALGDLVLIDVPALDAPAMAALARLDARAAHSGARLVVSTTIAALDDVFGCLDQSGAQILVAPSRAERVIALGRVLADLPRGKVRELSDEDRLTLLRLTEQVGQIAERLDRIAAPAAEALAGYGAGAERDGAGAPFRFESPAAGWAAAPGEASARLVRAARPPLPDPRLVRRIIRHRQLRARFFDGELFADPAWDILLDLTAARAEHQRVSVTSLCIASGVPPTTALRWIGQMVEAGLLARLEDETDRRRAFIALTDKAADAMARYFADLGRAGERLV